MSSAAVVIGALRVKIELLLMIDDFISLFFQTVKFKAYLLSMGIPDPVTRESHGTGDKYFTELARQLASVLENPIKVRSHVGRHSRKPVFLISNKVIFKPACSATETS